LPGSGDDNDDEDDGGGGGGLADNLWQDWQAKDFHGDIALVVMDMVVDVDLLTIFSRTGRPSIVMGEDQPPFIWDHVNAANASHLNIGNMMMMDQGLPNHQRMAFWGGMPVYWNADRSNYAPAPPIMRKEEL